MFGSERFRLRPGRNISMHSDTSRRSGWLVLGVFLAASVLPIGCGSKPQTGQIVEDAPGQAEGEQASMEEMQRLMKQGVVQ